MLVLVAAFLRERLDLTFFRISEGEIRWERGRQFESSSFSRSVSVTSWRFLSFLPMFDIDYITACKFWNIRMDLVLLLVLKDRIDSSDTPPQNEGPCLI